MNPPTVFSAVFESALQRWRGLNARERRLLVLAFLVSVSALLYLFVFEPAWQARSALEEQLPRLRAQVASVERLAADGRAREGTRSAAFESVQAVRLALERRVDAAGLRPSLTRLQVSGVVIDLSFREVPFGPWIEWLDAAVREQGLRVLDVSLTREGAPGQVSGRVLLETAQGAAGTGTGR
jgi:general secretion pathway protein M